MQKTIASHIAQHGIDLYPYWILNQKEITKFNRVVNDLNLDYQLVTNITNEWFMPVEYGEFDIKHYVLSAASTPEEIERVHYEMAIFERADLINLLKLLKYLVDTFRSNNILLGVGRGSSTHSFVLYLLGIHKVNSLFYDLNFNEFLAS